MENYNSRNIILILYKWKTNTSCKCPSLISLFTSIRIWCKAFIHMLVIYSDRLIWSSVYTFQLYLICRFSIGMNSWSVLQPYPIYIAGWIHSDQIGSVFSILFRFMYSGFICTHINFNSICWFTIWLGFMIIIGGFRIWAND